MTRKYLWPVLCAALFLFAACQKAPELTITSPSSIELDVNGNSGAITFTANRDWSASTSDSWISISPSSGKASDTPVTVTVRCNANTTYDERTATVTISMEDLSQTVSVHQPANLTVILPKQVFDLQSNSNTIEIEVQANVQYSVSTSVDWIKQVGTKGLTSKNISFSIEENKTYDPREGKITIKPQDSSVQEQVVSVKQAQKDALIVEKTSYDMPYGGGEIEIKVESNVPFDVTPNPDWIHYTQTKALSSSTVCLKIDENTTYSSRQGTVEIKQQNGSLKYTITVSQAGRIAITSVELDQTSLFIEPGETTTLTATVKPDNATDKTVTWSSSNTAIATVDETGKVTAVKEGTARIIAKAGEKAAECKVTVCIPVSSIELDKKELALKPGETAKLTATVKPDNATDKTVTWSSSDAEVALVDDSGKVTMVKEGSAIITAKAGDKAAECKVSVFISVTSIELDKTELSLELGESATLAAIVKPDNATDKTVTWSSSAPDVATVDGTGKVIMVKEGSATITAMAGEKTAECYVSIYIPVTSIELDITELTLDQGETAYLKAAVLPVNATDKTVIWSSSDTTIVATVGSSGYVKAIKEGSAIITAKAGDKTAICSLTVETIIPDGTVDLGILLSRGDGIYYRLFWAKCNIGASKPEEYGEYYAWGETETKQRYAWSVYKWENGEENKYTKYCPTDEKSRLDLEDDVAHVKLGGKWRMPTGEEWLALLATKNNTVDYTWTWCDGETEKYNGSDVKGWKIVRNATSATLFFPAAGYRYQYSLSLAGSEGHYWTNTLYSWVYAADIIFRSDKVQKSSHHRYYGLPVRPVTE